MIPETVWGHDVAVGDAVSIDRSIERDRASGVADLC